VADAEVALARILELSPHGIEQVEHEAEVDLVAYGDEALEAELRLVFAAVRSSPVESGWEERWREFHRPVVVAGLWIGPPWERPPDPRSAIVVDPGRAFGTGSHATTRLCIELLSSEKPGAVLDAGCGSGVVSLAAVRLGFAPVVGVDADPVAVECARENVARNGVAVDVRLVDVLREELPAADVVVANIELAAVEALLPRLGAGRAITSGYLAGRAPAVAGWSVVDTRSLDGWAAHALTAS
jgi:ribosomal protein L11 methyltransferase